MAVIKCKMCGGDMELSADKSVGTCAYCGSTMTLPRIDDEQRAAGFDRGNHFRRVGEFDKALSVYERMVQEDEGDAEAHWCCALCRFGIEYVKDPASGEYLPTCHRASFDSFLEDVDYEAALRYADVVAKAHYQSEGEKIAAVQRGILSISQKEEPFDVFLCYKETDDLGQRTVDSTLAQDIYYQLTEQGRRVFFARITLEDKAGREYEPYIFAALHSAPVMVVVGTRPEYLNAVWVKNEWSRYLALMKTDRKRLLIPCYRDMDPYDLPEQLSVLQAYDMSKIGFIQDLTRGIAKVLDADKPKVEAIREAVTIQGESGSLNALLKRGYMALEDGEWDRADDFFEQVLNLNAECAEAYLGKVLAKKRCSNMENFRTRVMYYEPEAEELAPYEDDHRERILTAINKYTVPGYFASDKIRPLLEFSKTAPSEVKGAQQALENAENFWATDKLMTRAVRFASGDLAQQLSSAHAAILQYFQQKLDEARKQEKENIDSLMDDYAKEMEQKEKHLIGEYERAIQRKEAQEKAKAEAEKKARMEAEEYERLRAKRAANGKRAAIAVLAVILIGLAGYTLTTRILIPSRQYKAAEELLAAGNYTEAFAAFRSLGTYKDSQEHILAILDQIAVLDTIAAGSRHTVGLKADGTVVASGSNNDGQCNVSNWGDIVAVSSGNYHTVGLRSNGTVVAAGSNQRNQCDVSSWADIVAVSAGDTHTIGLKTDGTVVAVGSNSKTQCKVSAWNCIVAVSAGGSHTVGLKSNGTVVATGDNSHNQCDVSSWTDIAAVSAGNLHTIGLKTDGTVVATGNNSSGQCDVSDWTNITAVAAGSNHTVGLTADGTVVVVGSNATKQREVSNWTDIVAVAAGSYCTVGLKADGTVVTTVGNTNSQHTVSTWINIKLPK